jgi:hypothetical protein
MSPGSLAQVDYASGASAVTSSRIGATVSVPVNTRQSIKIRYNNGAYVLYGGNYQSVSVAWQYFGLGRPN